MWLGKYCQIQQRGEHWLQTGYDPVLLIKKHHVNKRKGSLCQRLEHKAKREEIYFSNTRENVKNN